MRSPWAIAAITCVLVLASSGSARADTDAKALFEAGRWPGAAVALSNLSRSPAASRADKELAQYELAIALYRMQLRLPAFGIFSMIADDPHHSKRVETLLWLATLGADLPEPADVMERVGKYTDVEIAHFNNQNQREIYWRLCYLLGRYQLRNRQLEEAIRTFGLVGQRSTSYLQGQFLTGIASVQLRRSVPAVQAFQRMLAAIAEGGHADAAHMGNLALLSIARVYYSASVRIDDNNLPTVNPSSLSAAVKFYRKVDVTSSAFTDALFEESWALYLSGDYGGALGNLDFLSSSDGKARHAEGAVLGAMIKFLLCRYDETTSALTKLRATYDPLRAELARAEVALSTEDDAAHVALVRRELARPGSVVADTLSDRMFADHLTYDTYLADERKRFDATPASFRTSAAGSDAADVLTLVREIESRNIGQLAHERITRAREDLDTQLGEAAKLTLDLVAAQRSQLNAGIATNMISPSETSAAPAARPHAMSWPLNGLTAPPPSYRAAVTSQCPR